MAAVAAVHGEQGELPDAARANREMFEERRQALGAELGMFSFRLGFTLGGRRNSLELPVEFALQVSQGFTTCGSSRTTVVNILTQGHSRSE